MPIYCYAAFKAKSPLKKFSYDPKPLGSLDVEIKITHCGICHSDIHLIDNDWQISDYPLVPGHEIVGTVIAVGSKVKNLKKGRRVGVGWQAASCMKCEWCLKGEENVCNDYQPTCVGKYGGFAERIRVDSRFAFPIPTSLQSENAAPLLCGGVTVFAPMRRHSVVSGMKVGVIGVGGLGHLAVQFARAIGCEVTAFSSTPSKVKEAKGFGARHFIDSRDSRWIQKLERTFDFILSTVNVDLDWAAYLNALRPNGKLCIVGAVPKLKGITADALISGQKSLVGSAVGSRLVIQEMLEFAARHKIKSKIEVLPLSQVNAAIKKVRTNTARYRMVLCCA